MYAESGRFGAFGSFTFFALTAVFLVLVVFLAAILAMVDVTVVSRTRRGVARPSRARGDYSLRVTARRVFAGAFAFFGCSS